MSMADALRRAARVLGVALAWLLGRYRVVEVSDVPDAFDSRTLYVVGEDGQRWFAAFECPCGCGATIQTALMPKVKPHWILTEHWNGTPTLHPSVWRTTGCRSHFWLRRGRVHWC